MYKIKDSFVELNARDRAKAVLDVGTFRELIGPFDRFESPHLEAQDIVPQSDDGVIIAKGFIAGEPTVVVSIEGAFQGGKIGEVSGAKFAGALELALSDNEKGIRTRPVVLFDTEGVRLHEANYGLLTMAEIQSAVVALRRYVPVVGVIPGKTGCFGEMSITAGLFSTLIVTREGKLALNTPKDIEQEAGKAEFNSKNKQLSWKIFGGAQREAMGLADIIVEDDITAIVEAIHSTVISKKTIEPRSSKVGLYLSRLNAIDPSVHLDPIKTCEMWGAKKNSEKLERNVVKKEEENKCKNAQASSRGRVWYEKLTGISNPKTDDDSSVLCSDVILGEETARYIAVVPNTNNRFPRARHGEIGLEEGWTIAKYIREAIKEDEGKEKRRPIIAVVDVPGQAYGYNEELLGIFLSCSAAVDAYATARYAGHPIITLIVGNAISGALLAHGYQASRIVALDDPGVLVHVMSKEAEARTTKCSIADLEEKAKNVPSISYDINSYSTLGALHELVSGIHADAPTIEDTQKIKSKLVDAISIARISPRDLRNRLTSEKAIIGRATSIKVRENLAQQWN